jgi:L-ascorbate metabolism protein UlaG (beta-lactamase superfamily)
MSITYLGFSAFYVQTSGLTIYIDPYFKDQINWNTLPKADIVLFSHGHFDHGVQMANKLYERWHCKFVAPTALVTWMKRKFKKSIPHVDILALNHEQSIEISGLKIEAIIAHHPLNRLGKTIMRFFSRSSAPGNPVNGYLFDGYYHSGDTVYTEQIALALKGKSIHTACLPIGGKYKVANPEEALKIAEEIKAKRLVPMHWQALVQEVPFKFQPSDLLKLAKENKSKVQVHSLAIGQSLE